MVTDREFQERSDAYADPTKSIGPVGSPTTGASASAEGRKFFEEQWGSVEALEQDVRLRRGRPRVGESKGNSPVVRARLTAADFEAFKQLEEITGKTQAELVREGVHLLLEQHLRAS